MTPEEYERFKEAEKAHLRKLKELKKAVHSLERQKTVRTAVESITEGQDLLEKQKDLVDELAMETARQEARLDVALEGAAEAERAEQAEALEEALQRDRAQALIRQLKREMGGGDVESGTSAGDREPDEESERSGSAANPTTGRDDRPEKTIGRM